MSFKVIKSSFLSTVQDYGRLNHGEHGMSQSGVMDEHAYTWGNHLLHNDFNDAVVEITFGGLVLEAQIDTFIAVTGADLGFKINNQSVQLWHGLQIHKGDIISWDIPKSGVRAYLSVKGGFDTPVLFDSRSVNLREHIGAKLVKGDVLPCKGFDEATYRFIPPKYVPNYNQDLTIRILPTYQFNEFSINQRDLFFNQNYTITNANDRTGCRLSGAPISIKKERMISEGISYGSVEIATDGLPIILLKDTPSIGGYPKIGTVFSLDLAKLAQRQPNTKLRFKLIDIHEAQKERKKFNEFFEISF
ncbi:MAG: biotin-dependent carboxyltransferase family protein [Candidatus Ruthia sp.]|nr:biotin-dependent carboxyltransferase family protein [Candidatus Ruthturnera sp.]MBT4122726.1 biotin-dependent carboxyltransferase family protein [Candidatus Ruthturnera sp.]MBT6922346.1 biotin-dependent carboxyltransferase family protein [Candidatus Ruthturnera sp.]